MLKNITQNRQLLLTHLPRSTCFGLSNKILCILVAKGAAKLREVKFGGLKNKSSILIRPLHFTMLVQAGGTLKGNFLDL